MTGNLSQSERVISAGQRWSYRLLGLIADTTVAVLVLRLLCRLSGYRPLLWMLLLPAFLSALLAPTIEKACVRYNERRIARQDAARNEAMREKPVRDKSA